MKLSTFIFIFLFSITSIFGANSTLSGYIFEKNTKNKIANANISLVGTKYSAVSQKDGYYKIKNIIPGKYDIKIYKDGYSPIEIKNFKIKKGVKIKKNFKLKKLHKIRAKKSESKSERKTKKVMGKYKMDDVKEYSGTIEVAPTSSYKKSRSRRGGSSTPSISGLKASFADDNKQFNYFLNFLEKYKEKVKHFPLNISERIKLTVKDIAGKPLPNSQIQILKNNKVISEGKTFADGSYFFYPGISSLKDDKGKKYKVLIKSENVTKKITIERQGKRIRTINLKTQRGSYKNIPLDILFILDTTGSMGEEIERLKNTIDIINMNLTGMTPKPNVRFGMVLYKDKSDSYRTKTIPFTNNLKEFTDQLESVSASGGGDTPEDLQAALDIAINKMEWRNEGIKMSFIITDASAHLDYGQQFKYTNAAIKAKQNAIKIFSIGTGGLGLDGEYVLRQVSQLTYAKYIFLNYGETGESSGGVPGSVSHHTGSNYETDKLEAIIIRFAKDELSYLSDTPIQLPEEYFTANKIDTEKKEETLNNIFSKAISQLIDYSTIKIAKGSTAAVVPFINKNKKDNATSEYLTEQLILTLAKNDIIKQVERKNLQKIFEELGLNLSGLVDDNKTIEAGKILGAGLLITGSIFENEKNWEIYLKLLRTETAEVLSVTKLKLNKSLGL